MPGWEPFLSPFLSGHWLAVHGRIPHLEELETEEYQKYEFRQSSIQEDNRGGRWRWNPHWADCPDWTRLPSSKYLRPLLMETHFITGLDAEFSPASYSLSYLPYSDKPQKFSNHWVGRSLVCRQLTQVPQNLVVCTRRCCVQMQNNCPNQYSCQLASVKLAEELNSWQLIIYPLPDSIASVLSLLPSAWTPLKIAWASLQSRKSIFSIM